MKERWIPALAGMTIWDLFRGSVTMKMESAVKVKVFWQPGCTSCLRTKEFLTAQGVNYESINVQDDENGMTALRELGARSVPVVALGEQFVYAQSLADVIKFLGLNLSLNERLPPEQLAQRVCAVLAAALRYVQQIPDDKLATDVRNRKRSGRELAHHVFRIIEAFLEATAGATLTYESTVMGPGAQINTKADILRYGEGVLARFKRWWAACPDKSCMASVVTYYGSHSMHEVLERSAWHSAQHTRQLMMLLEMLSIAPNGPLTEDDLNGLPLPEKVWDD
jgi:glutaredoxin